MSLAEGKCCFQRALARIPLEWMRRVVSHRAGSSPLDGVTHRYPLALLLPLTVGYAVQSRQPTLDG